MLRRRYDSERNDCSSRTVPARLKPISMQSVVRRPPRAFVKRQTWEWSSFPSMDAERWCCLFLFFLSVWIASCSNCRILENTITKLSDIVNMHFNIALLFIVLLCANWISLKVYRHLVILERTDGCLVWLVVSKKPKGPFIATQLNSTQLDVAINGP